MENQNPLDLFNAVKFSELKPNTTYFSVCCGSVSKLFFVRDIDGNKFEVKYQASDLTFFAHHHYYDDFGVWDNPGHEYKNYYNRMFHTKDEAKDYINSDAYKSLMLEKEIEDEYYDSILDSYED